MVRISNGLSHHSPIPESVLESEAARAFENSDGRVPDGIETFLGAITARSESEGYKFVVSASSLDAATRGPLKTYTGAYWNAEQDGVWSTYLEKPKLLLSLTWIHT